MSESRNFLVIIKVRIIKQQVIFLVIDGLDLGSFVSLIWGPGQNQKIIIVPRLKVSCGPLYKCS